MRWNVPSTGEMPSEILARAQAGRKLIQDFCPLAESIEWQLGQRYFQERGNKAFINDARPVPYVVHNDGNLSIKAADLLFASLEAAERDGTLEEHVFVLELGFGVGLFARFFLDRMAELSERHGKDFYDRLTYVATDRSEKMLLDACRHGIFANHAGHYLLRVVDAMDAWEGLKGDIAFIESGERPFRAVFLNYILDCLPAAILQINECNVLQICIRTYVARGIDLADYTDLSVEEIARRACSSDSAGKCDLIPLYGLLAFEYAYRQLDPRGVPHGEFAVEYCRGKVRHFLHSYGAVQCLERMKGLLCEGGFILIDDYGHAKLEELEDGYELQRFSGSTAIGLNFLLLRECLQHAGVTGWVEPAEDDDSHFGRLLANSVAPRVVQLFLKLFGKQACERSDAPLYRARAYIQQKRFELATGAYQQALKQQPWNWALMSEVAKFLTFCLRDPAGGLALDRAALRLNPSCSSDLWNNLGDSLFSLSRLYEAYSAFQRALRVNSADVRARYNLACYYNCQKDYPAALLVIAEGLAIDKSSSYTEGFMKLQADALRRQGDRNRLEVQLITNRVSRSSDVSSQSCAYETTWPEETKTSESRSFDGSWTLAPPSKRQ